MTDLVDDLLDVSCVTRGLVSIEKAPLGIEDVVQSAIEQTKPLIESGNHALTVRLASDDAVVQGIARA
jgi:hypothetical protein